MKAALATLAVAAGLVVLPAPAAQADVLLDETFRGESTPSSDWIMVDKKNTPTRPCLTAARTDPPQGSLPKCFEHPGSDPKGQGALQLTADGYQDAGGVIYNRPVDAKKGLHIEFDLYMYNTSDKGVPADGVSFFLIDGATGNPDIGDYGGNLGYRGMPGGLLGFGFDQYGYFSHKVDDKDPAPNYMRNTVAVRGPAADKYRYIVGRQLDETNSVGATEPVSDRSKAKRHVTIDLSSHGFMSLYMDFGRGDMTVFQNRFLPNLGTLPDDVKLGFAASTGDRTSFHEITDLVVSTLDPDLVAKVTPKGEFKAGGKGTFTIDTANKPVAYPAPGPITTTFKVPDGTVLDSAKGDGWTCDPTGREVTCTRAEGLQPGEAASQITVLLDLPEQTVGPAVSLTATSTSPKKDQFLEDNTSTGTANLVQRAPAKPDATIKITLDGAFKAGGGGGSTTTVSNVPTAGPATGPTTVKIASPPDLTMENSTGSGWDCTVSDGKTSACTRSDGLKQGDSFPPIKTAYKVPETLKANRLATFKLLANVATMGDSNPANDNDEADITIEEADLAIGDIICHGGTVNVQFNPAVGFKSGTTRLAANGDLGFCMSAKHSRITGGTFRAEASMTAACPGPVGPGYAKVSIIWSNGAKTVINQSTFRGDAFSFGFDGGQVVEGLFKGGTARANGRATTNLFELGAGCALGGLTGYSAGIDTFAIGSI